MQFSDSTLVSLLFMFQKMSFKFAFDFMSLNRPDRTPAVSYDNLYSSIHKIMMNSKQQRDDNPKEAHFNLQMVQQLLSSYKPDLKIVSEDQESIQTYKLLLGMSSKLFGGIFLQEDFVTESVTTLIVPLHSKHVKLMVKYFENGSKPPDDIMHLFLFSGSASSHSNNTLNIDENILDNDNLMSEEVKAEDDIKVDEEGESHVPVKPVLIKFQSVVKTSKSKSSKAKCPKVKCLKCGEKYRFINKHTQEKCDKVRFRKSKCSRTKCLKCGVKFRDINKHTDEACYKERSSRGSRVPCELCGKILRKDVMIRHMERFHNSEGLTTFPCELCGKMLPQRLSIRKDHMIKFHNPEGPTYYNCDKCAFKTIHYHYLKRHMTNHEGFLETCHICGGKYKRLEVHIRRNHNSNITDMKNMIVKCEICGKEVRKVGLSDHMKHVHTERKHACHLCSYKAQTGYNLKLHISKSHLGVKELEKKQCPECDILTTNLSYHLKHYH